MSDDNKKKKDPNIPPIEGGEKKPPKSKSQ